MIRENSLSIPLVAYGWQNLFAGKFEVPAKCIQLGTSYLLNKIFRKDADQKTIRHRASFTKNFPYKLFEECSLKKLTMNQNFMYCIDELATVKTINKNIVIVTRNMESLVETYLNSTHEFGMPVHQYIEGMTGFKFVVVGNELELTRCGNEIRATGIIKPGNNASLLNDSLISMLTKIDLYADKIVLSDREEVSNRDVKKQGKKGAYYIINMQVPLSKIKQRLILASRLLQNKHPANYQKKSNSENPYDEQVDTLVEFLTETLGENLGLIIGYGSYFRKPSKPNRRPDLIVIVDDYAAAHANLGDKLFWTKSMKNHNASLNEGSINYYNLKLNNEADESKNGSDEPPKNSSNKTESDNPPENGLNQPIKFKIGIISKKDLRKKSLADFYVSGRMSKENVSLYIRNGADTFFMQNILETMQERFVNYASKMCSGRTSKEEFLTKYLAISYLAEPYRWFDRKTAAAILGSELTSEGKISDLLYTKLIKYIPPENLECGNGNLDTAATGFNFTINPLRQVETYLKIISQGISGFKQSWKNHFETNKKYSNDPIVPKEYFREKRRK